MTIKSVNKLKTHAQYYWEKYNPIIIGTLIGLLFHFNYHLVADVNETVKAVLTATSTACGTLLGFFFTATTIILGITSRRMAAIKANKESFRLFIRYMKGAIWLCIAIVSVAIMDSFLRPVACNANRLAAYNTGIIVLASWSWASSLRFARIFIRSLYDKSDVA